MRKSRKRHGLFPFGREMSYFEHELFFLEYSLFCLKTYCFPRVCVCSLRYVFSLTYRSYVVVHVVTISHEYVIQDLYNKRELNVSGLGLRTNGVSMRKPHSLTPVIWHIHVQHEKWGTWTATSPWCSLVTWTRLFDTLYPVRHLKKIDWTSRIHP